MELDINIILDQYKRKCADLQHDNIMLTAQAEALFVRNKELEEKIAKYEKPCEVMEEPKKKGVK